MSLLLTAAVVATKAIDWVMIGKDVGVPIFIACVSFFGGRKSAIEKKKSEFETLQQELEAFKSYRQLLIDDNNSLIKELREMKKQLSEMKEQLKELSKDRCSKFPTCTNKETL